MKTHWLNYEWRKQKNLQYIRNESGVRGYKESQNEVLEKLIYNTIPKFG